MTYIKYKMESQHNRTSFEFPFITGFVPHNYFLGLPRHSVCTMARSAMH